MPWNITGNIRGAQGAQGSSGAQGSQGSQGTAGTQGSQGTAGAAAFTGTTFSVVGNLSTMVGTLRWFNDTGSTRTIIACRASVGTAPTGSSLIVDVNYNGTTIFTTQANRPTVAATGTTSGAITNMNVTAVNNGGYLTVDIDQVGSTIAGSDLTVSVTMT